MKSFISSILLCLSLGAVGLQAAAVEPVVEELHTDVSVATPIAAVETELITNEDCHQPKETGRCFALFYRFAYDLEKRECVEFIYGGCAGNSNNFETKEDCESKCMKKSVDVVEATTIVALKEAEEEEKALDTTISYADAVTDTAVAS